MLSWDEAQFLSIPRLHGSGPSMQTSRSPRSNKFQSLHPHGLVRFAFSRQCNHEIEGQTETTFLAAKGCRVWTLTRRSRPRLISPNDRLYAAYTAVNFQILKFRNLQCCRFVTQKQHLKRPATEIHTGFSRSTSCVFNGVGPWNNLTGACLKFAGV